MDNVINTYRKLKYLTDTIDESTSERLREYTDELTVPLNSLPITSSIQGKTLKKATSATSSSASIASRKSSEPSPVAFNINTTNSAINPTIPEIDHDSGNDTDLEEDTNAMFTRDQFHIRNDQLFSENAATSKELVDLLSGLSNEEIQPILDEIITTTYELDEQRQESQYEENYDLFVSLIQKMKHSSSLRIEQLSHSLQLLIHRQKEIFDITLEKYKQEYGFYRMKNRHAELINQIQKYSFKLSEIKYELSLKQEEFNISAEELRNRYEQELEAMIRKLLQTIEEKKEEVNALTNKHQNIQTDIDRICNDLSLILHELDREEKAKAYAAIYGSNKKFIDNRPLPTLPKITTEKIEEAFAQARIDKSSITATSPKKVKNESKTSSNGKSPNNRSPKGPTIPNQKGSKSNRSPTQQPTSVIVPESDKVEPVVEELDSNHIFQVFPFLDTREITEDMVIESLKIADALLLEVEGKKKELQQQEEKMNEEKAKTQNLLKSEDNKALERLKLMVANLEAKIEIDSQRVELLQTLVKNLTSEAKGDYSKSKKKSIHRHPHTNENKDDITQRKTGDLVSGPKPTRTSLIKQAENESGREEDKDQNGSPLEQKEMNVGPTDSLDYNNLSEVEVNVLKYQEFYEKCQGILKVEREKILSREKTPRNRAISIANKSRPISSSVPNVKPFSEYNRELNDSIDSHQLENDAGMNYIQTNDGAPLNEKPVIKRLITPQQVGKIHKIMEMFDYYTNLNDLSDVDKMNNTLIPYSNTPLGWNSASSTAKASGGGGISGMESPVKSRGSTHQTRMSSPSRSVRSLSPSKSIIQISTFPNEERVADLTATSPSNQLPEIEVSNTRSTSGRRAAITSPHSKSVSPRSNSPREEGDNKRVSRVASKGSREKEKGYQLALALQEQENSDFFSENYGYKLAIEQVSTIYNILLKWNHPAADQLSASNIVNNSIILQTDREENELLTIEVLKSQIQSLLMKCKGLYRQNTYYHSIIKDLSKELIHDIKKNSQYTTELIAEISNLRWGQNTLPGKYQLEIDASKERLMQLKKECKIWEGKVSKRRVTNIRLSNLLSENSKNVRKSLPLKSSFQMVQAIVQENHVVENKEIQKPKSHMPILYSSSLSHGPQPFASIPMQSEMIVSSTSSNPQRNGIDRPDTQHSDLGIDLFSTPAQPLQPRESTTNK